MGSRPLGLSESKHLFCLACLSEVVMSLSPAFCSTILHKESNLKHEEISYNGISRMVKIASENISADKKFKSSDLILQNRIQRVREAALILRRSLRIQELVDDGAWKP